MTRPGPGVIDTERLRLRQWREADLEPFAALNADPRVMEHFPAPLTRRQSDAAGRSAQACIEEQGWGLFAVEVIGGAPFIGFCGLSTPRFEADFTPCVEIGWRLAREHWGNGYAPEAARAVLALGFGAVGLEEMVSFTAVGNHNSRRVMEKIGMALVGEFDHPDLPGHRLERHVLYRIDRGD